MSTATGTPAHRVPGHRTPSHRAETPAEQRRHAHVLAGTGRLARQILRRDRRRMLTWAAVMTVFIAYFAVALSTVFDASALAARAAVMRTPSGIVMGGPGYGLDDYTPLVAVANEGTTWIVMALSVMAILHVVRHTRAEEESGRAELVRAGAVGRMAPAVATLATLAAHLLVIAVLGALATFASQGEDTSLVDGLGLMLASAASALVFGAAALVVAQIVSTSRGAVGLSLAVFGAAFAVRSAGDLIALEGSTLSWFSPLAWAQQMRAFVDLRWWPLLLSSAATAALLGLASALAARRDLGQGMVPARPGHPGAPGWLRGPVAMAWRQQLATLGWCSLGLGLLWFGSGSMLDALGDMATDLVAETPALGALFGEDPDGFITSFLAVIMLFVALCAGAYAIVATHQQCRGEESSGRLELVLAAPVSRTGWFAAQLAVALAGAAVLLAVCVGAIWAGAALVGVTEPGSGEYATVFATHLPAVLSFAAVSALLYGWAPRLAGLSWLLLSAVLVIGMFGAMFEFPEAVLGISPFHWVPAPFAATEGGDLARTLGLSVVVLALLVLALLGFRRREIRSGS